MNIIQLIESVRTLSPVDLNWAKEVIDTELKIRADEQIDQSRAVPRFYAQESPAGQAEVLHVSESGATSSHVPLRYDLIPAQLLHLAAARYTLGVKIHGERGYQKGFADRDFIINRINHIQEHWLKLFHANSTNTESVEEHIGAILWGLGFVSELLTHKQGNQILRTILAEGNYRE